MDDETRGFIEKLIDDVLEVKIMTGIDWLQDKIPIKSLEDLALGYAIGVLERLASDVVIMKTRKITEDDSTEITRILERKLPEIREKIAMELGR